MNDKSNSLLVFVGLILAAVCFGVGWQTAAMPKDITIRHEISLPDLSTSYARKEPGFVIKLDSAIKLNLPEVKTSTYVKEPGFVIKLERHEAGLELP